MDIFQRQLFQTITSSWPSIAQMCQDKSVIFGNNNSFSDSIYWIPFSVSASWNWNLCLSEPNTENPLSNSLSSDSFSLMIFMRVVMIFIVDRNCFVMRISLFAHFVGASETLLKTLDFRLKIISARQSEKLLLQKYVLLFPIAIHIFHPNPQSEPFPPFLLVCKVELPKPNRPTRCKWEWAE